jgi:hypothetical protein
VKFVLVWARSVVLGWVTLLGLAYLVERPLLHLIFPLLGATWSATAHLTADCLTLAASGWIAGRFNQANAILSAGLFAVTLCFWDFGGVLTLNVPWLLLLIENSFHDSRFLDSLATSAETHALLFGCLIVGAALSRPREKAVSITDVESR